MQIYNLYQCRIANDYANFVCPSLLVLAIHIALPMTPPSTSSET